MKDWFDEYLKEQKKVEALEKVKRHLMNREEQLREALTYYANEENYRNTISLGHPQIDGSTSPIKLDNGEKARLALQPKDNTK